MKAAKFFITATLIGWLAGIPLFAANVESNICIFGGTSAGIIAAAQSAKMGKTVIIVEPGSRLVVDKKPDGKYQFIQAVELNKL